MPIKKFLDLSTGHLPTEDRLLVDLYRPHQMPFRVVSNDFGWSMWLLDERAMEKAVIKLEHDLGFTDALGHVIRYALYHGCAMINFDCDADRIDGLGYFDE